MNQAPSLANPTDGGDKGSLKGRVHVHKSKARETVLASRSNTAVRVRVSVRVYTLGGTAYMLELDINYLH